MKKLLPVLALVLAASSVQAGQRVVYDPIAPPQPTPYDAPLPAPALTPAPQFMTPTPATIYPSGPLFQCVEYDDLDEVAPCAVEKIVPIKLKTKRHFSLFHHHDDCACEARTVFVKICVPPCACESVKVSADGTKATYYYGKYKVEVKGKYDKVEVEYHD